MLNPATKMSREAAHLLLGLVLMALLTWTCFWFNLGVASTAFTYLILVVLLSLPGGLLAPVVLSVVAVACLNYFFAPPLFDFHVDLPEDIAAMGAFLVTALVVTGLVQKVKAGRNELGNLLDSIRALVWNTSADGSVEFSNRRFRDYTGFSAEELRGRGWMEALHPEDCRTAEWSAALAAGEPFEKEARLRSAAGEYRWFVLRMMPLRDERGAISKWYGIASDIEERRRTLEALRDSEEQWRAVFAHNPTMYFMVDSAGTVLSVNPFGAAQLGYAADELIGRSVLDVFYEADRDAIKRNTAACLERLDRSMSWEARKVRKNGTVLWVRETAKATLMKQRPVILIVCEDITERKRAEEALRRSEACLAEGQRLTHTGSWIYNPATERALYWSDEQFRIHGLDPRKDMPDQTVLLRQLHPEDRGRVIARFMNAFRDKIGVNEEFRIVLNDGTVKHLHAVGHPIIDATGELTEFIGTAVDVTQRRRAEEALRETQRELAHSNRVATMGQLTASIAHEVNQPITAILTNAQVGERCLDSRPPDLEEVRQALARIVNDGRRAGDVMARIRNLVKKNAIRTDRLDINGAISEVIELTRAEAVKNGISVRNQLADGLPLVQGDRVELQQVMLNLIINAVEAMSETSEGPRELVITAEHSDSSGVRVAVGDSGPGLGPENVERVFDSFYTTKSSGMGMGLSICRSIIEAHGGRLWASANAPRGAVFQFTLPTQAAPQ